MRLSKLIFAIFTVSLFILPASARAAAVNLQWEANTEPDLSYYNVYYGTASRTYGNPIPAGKQTSHMVDGLEKGKTYYFAITAVDTSGNESGFSDEVSAHATSSEPTASPYELLFSTNSSRSGGIPLNNQTVANNIFVFVEPEDYIESVVFSIDGKAVRTEKYAPYDLAGGAANKANPLDTQTLSNGSHTISAKLVLQDKSTVEIDATINVSNATANSTTTTPEPAPSPYELLFSTNSSRSGGIPLNNQAVANNIFVFVQPENYIESVDFSIDGKAVRTEKIAPYDLAGGAANKANPLDTQTLSNGSHTISAKVVLQDNSTVVINSTINVANTTANSTTTTPLTAGVTASKSSPQVPGESITFTGSATGGVEPHQYQFRLKNSATNKTTTVQDYSGDKTWSWNTNGYQEGDYTIYLWVRNAGSNNNWDAYAQFAFKLQDNSVLQSPQPLEAVVTPDMTSPQIKGQKVTFTGSASGGSGTYEYLFRLQDVTKKWATTVQQYSSDTTWTWNTGTYDTGDYKISLWVRNAGSQAEWEAWDQIAFKLQDNSVPQQPQPLEAVVTPDVASPQVKGQKVTFTGSATGGSGTYEYLFRLRDVNKKWAVTLQPYSSDTTWTWNTGTYDTGDYKISVWVRNAGSQAEWEAWDQIPYKLK